MIILAILILISTGLLLTSAIICIFLPQQMGGVINWGKKQIPSLALGIPMALVGILIFSFAIERIYNAKQRRLFDEQVKYYLQSDKRYIISGGKDKTDRILVDEDLRIILKGEQTIISDMDGLRSDFGLATYKGDPLVFYNTDGGELWIRARDSRCCNYYLSPLYLHQPDGTVRKLTAGVKGEKYSPPLESPRIFFDETYELEPLEVSQK